MDKYIVEIDGKNICTDSDGSSKLALSVKADNGYAVFCTEIPLKPYTEPDMEQVKADAYSDGYKAGREAERVRQSDLEQVNKEKDELYDEARARGYDEGRARGYQEGLFDAWECARKISSMDSYTRNEIYEEVITTNILEHNSASECIEKIRQYELEKEEIQLWDEVINGRSFKGTVTDIEDNGTLTIFGQDGTWIISHARFWEKTGRRFDEFATVLRKMRNEDEEN